MLESFFRTHRMLVENVDVTIKRALMNEIDWRQRLIGIKGSRGVGKTTFLLQYARDCFGPTNRKCLYVNMNNFFFQSQSLYEFAREFESRGGKVLLIDQVFKYPEWSHELRMIYDRLDHLKVVFTGSSVISLKDENPELKGFVKSYNLRGFSFREYINLQTGLSLKPVTLDEINRQHEFLARQVCKQLNPLDYFHSYLRYGYYPFFLKKTDFSEELLKVMNMMIEVDILIIKQIDQKYLSKIKKLLYLLYTTPGGSPNVSQLAAELHTSRATVMNYIKYLTDARMLNMIYRQGEQFPKKPSAILPHNTNLSYVMNPDRTERQKLLEVFFQNALWGRYKVSAGERTCSFVVDGQQRVKICLESPRRKNMDITYVLADTERGSEREVPLWLYGFLY